MTIFFDEKEREDSLSSSTYVQQLSVPQAKKGKRKINMKSQMPSPPPPSSTLATQPLSML